MRLQKEIYMQEYDRGKAYAEVTEQARFLLILHNSSEKPGGEKIKEFLNSFPDQSKDFLKEALEIAKKYPGYSEEHLSQKMIFESTRMPYNFEEYENWKEQIQEAAGMQKQEDAANDDATRFPHSHG